MQLSQRMQDFAYWLYLADVQKRRKGTSAISKCLEQSDLLLSVSSEQISDWPRLWRWICKTVGWSRETHSFAHCLSGFNNYDLTFQEGVMMLQRLVELMDYCPDSYDSIDNHLQRTCGGHHVLCLVIDYIDLYPEWQTNKGELLQKFKSDAISGFRESFRKWSRSAKRQYHLTQRENTTTYRCSIWSHSAELEIETSDNSLVIEVRAARTSLFVQVIKSLQTFLAKHLEESYHLRGT